MNLPAVSHPEESIKAGDADSTGEQHRIIVADDDTSILQFTTRALERAGFTVDTAKDGVAAWDALQMGQFDLLITDHLMPGIRGLELIMRLRAAGMTLPVIMVSGTMPTLEMDQYPSVRIDARLHKPFAITELLETVNSLLHMRHLCTSSAEESSFSTEGFHLFPNRHSHP